MPQKLNSAGKMQNYVPAGHPAGGEYGDNATGSNKHFTNFKKPRQYKTYWKKISDTGWGGITKFEYEKLKQKGENVEERELSKNTYWSEERMINNFLDKHPDLENEVKDILNGINDKNISLAEFKNTFTKNLQIPFDIRRIVLDAFYDDLKDKWNELHSDILKEFDNLSKDTFNKIKNKINISPNLNSDFVLNSISLGTQEGQELVLACILHGENGVKYFNYGEVKDKDGSFINETCQSKNRIIVNELHDTGESYQEGQVIYHETFHRLDQLYSQTSGLLYASNELVIDGKTLQEVLKKETRYNVGEILRKKIRDDLAEWKDNYLNERLTDEDRNNIDLYNKAQMRINKEVYGDSDFVFDDDEYLLKKEYNKRVQEYENNNPEQLKAINKRAQIRAERPTNKIWGDVSDTYCGSTNGKESLGMGHSTSYFATKESKANEFFVEYCSAKFTNPESFKLLNKYYPESCKQTEKMLKYIIENKGKNYEYR